ncbi:hypothetical protein CLV51_1011064 [Chitinophaga niastensis]|uniref:Uncharacterized protein n=1 Tax=Chitinophaga niastensis TaxID=536980 RepID=A0A2P8HU18_CHINA|nr:hypothetical protein [Chitinophaga niastensis]PSL49729.1 hypothetical protein CLV51_1011064 [Chitinophaga niastensis]
MEPDIRFLTFQQWKIIVTMMIVIGMNSCRKDTLHPVSLCPKMETIPVTDTLIHVIASNTLLTASHSWYIKGWVYVNNEASLRMEPGTIINILPDDEYKNGGLVITRGAYINAVGTDRLPVHFNIITAGGIVILGKAPTAKPLAVWDNPETPLQSGLAFGGSVKEDSSGILQHVLIDYPANNKTSGLWLLGTGTKTVIQNVTTQKGHNGIKHIHLP